MAIIAKLGFKDNPSSTSDDYVDLNALTGSLLNPTGVGFILRLGGYAEGAAEGNYRELTLNLDIEGVSRDDVISRYRNLLRIVHQTRLYFKRFTGDRNPNTPVNLEGINLPARLDGSWHQGHAAVLTFQADGASKPVYWNVIDYRLEPEAGSLAGIELKTLSNVTLTLIVEAAARGNRVILDNLVACGDYCPQFTTTGNQLLGGWTLGSSAWTQVDGSVVTAKYGYYCLRWTAGVSTTTTSNGSSDFQSIDTLVASIWVRGTINSGSLTVKVQGFNGASWVDLGVSLSGSAVSNSAWTQWTSNSFTVNTGTYSQIRLAIVSPTNGTLYFDGAAIWRNPVGNTVPVEYATFGKLAGLPDFNIYNVQGDTPAPVQLRFSGSRYYIIGYGHYDPSFEFPIPALGFNTATGSTSSTMFFGALGTVSTGALSSSSYNFSSTAQTYPVDYRPRAYRAILIYAANDSAGITSVKLNVGTTDKTYSKSLPQTYTGNTTPTVSQYRAYYLGEFAFRRPGSSWEEVTATLDQFSNVNVVLNHSSNANRQTAVAGVILLPALEFGVLDGGNAGPAVLGIYTESGEAVPGYNTGNTYSNPIRDNPSTGLSLTGSNFYLIPNANANGATANRFEILTLVTKDATYSDMYTFDASLATHASIRYSPRYLSGAQ